MVDCLIRNPKTGWSKAWKINCWARFLDDDHAHKMLIEAVADAWDRQLNRQRVQLCKVSFVPDHVHLAIRTHPSVVPADLVVELLNSSQQLMFQAFDELVIATGNRRLWQPSAYVGTYGDLSNQQVQAYLRNWRNGSTNQLAGPRQPT